MKCRFFKVMAAMVMVFLLAGCGDPIRSSAHGEVNLSGWMAYWDMPSALKEYKEIQGRMESICYFAAYFDADDHLVVPPEVAEAKKQQKKGRQLTYLTIVNDSDRGEKGKTEKDISVLYHVLGSEASMDEHIQEIISLTKAGGYDGVEIDYEKFWKDAELKQEFMDFTYRLSTETIRNGLKLRIVLEPSAPFDAGFCQGPEYVVMLYNLYGTHSGPGPKANGDFIQKTIDKMAVLPGKKIADFSVGGCVWEGKGPLGIIPGKKRFLTEAEAQQLLKKYGAKESRDPESACMVFKYEDGGRHYTVWYADSETLNAWITVAAERGIDNISLWRLGSNTDIEKVR